MFDDEDELRVYTLGQDSPPSVLKFSRRAPTYTVREMTLGAFVDAIANEWSILEEGQDTAEKEREAVLEYAEAVGPLYSFADFIEDIREGVHREGEDEEEEMEEEEDPTSGEVPAPPEPPPPPPEPAKV
jgi:hypothetical protein